MFSPGIRFIGRVLVSSLAHWAIGFGVLLLLRDLLRISVPLWILATCSLISYIAQLKLKPLLEARKNARKAQAQGATLPPHVEESGMEVFKMLTNRDSYMRACYHDHRDYGNNLSYIVVSGYISQFHSEARHNFQIHRRWR